jgi:hypothetical protein
MPTQTTAVCKQSGLGRCAFPAVFTWVLCAAIGFQPAAAAPTAASTSWWQWFDLRSSPFVPIPEVGTDPNSGTTIGLLPVFLFNNEQNVITQIVAPDLTYNPSLGYGAHARLFSYPSSDTQWTGVLTLKQRIERGADFLYATGLTRVTSWSYSLRLLYDRSATYRFFGIGNSSRRSSETNYTNEQALADATLAWNISPALQFGWLFHPQIVRIEPGAVTSFPFIRTAFPNLPGGADGHELLNRVFVSIDTRDSNTLPTMGSQLVASVGAANRGILSTMSYTVLGIDIRHYQPVHDRVTIAGHMALRYMPEATNAPFWSLSSLGGDRSIISEQQPLRGFGEGRFVDRNLSSVGVEIRTRVLDLHLFSTDVSAQVAPFIEAGSVFHSVRNSPLRKLHTVGGVGFRAIADPFIVGYVDVGYGSEGVAVFSGINYPF